MRYIEVPGEIDNNNRLILHESLAQIKPQMVEIDIWFRDNEEEDYRQPAKEEILSDIHESLREYSRGECSSVSEMWNDMMLQSTGEINEKGQLIIDEPLKEAKAQYVDVVIRFVLDKNYIKNRESEENIYEENITLVREFSQSSVSSHAR